MFALMGCGSESSHFCLPKNTSPLCLQEPRAGDNGLAGRTWEGSMKEKQPGNPSPKGFVELISFPEDKGIS